MKKLTNSWDWYANIFPKLDLKMKLSFLFVFLVLFQLKAESGYSQNTKITLDMGTTSILEVMNEIETISEFRFFYSKENLGLNKKVLVKVKNKKIADVLELLFPDDKINYKVIDRHIILTKNALAGNDVKTSIEPQIIEEQQRTVSGKVKDEKGQPLPGANIVEKGTTNGTQTDFDGNYSISITTDNPVLIFSYIGFKKQEKLVAEADTINATMVTDSQGLDEVVVIGYGTTTRRDLTGSVSTIKSEELVSVPTTGLDQALQGRAAGVYVSQAQADPGGGTVIRIRGTSSIQGNNSPLFVIDGFIGGDINSVDPTDIASIDVLKDASATSIYGTSGANGVVIVTTKKGKVGKAIISLDSYYGLQEVANRLDLLSAQEYVNVANAIDVANGNEPSLNPNNIENNIDWQDVIFQSAPIQSHNLKASGGSENIRYYVGLNLIKQDGVVVGSGFDRQNYRINLDSKISEKLSVGTQLGISRVKNNRLVPQDNVRASSTHQPVLSALILPSIVTPYDSNGDLIQAGLDVPNSGATLMNPLNTQLNWLDETISNIINGNVFLEYEILNGLKFRSSFGININNSKTNQFRPSTVFDPSSGLTNYASINTNNTNNWLNENYFTYKKDFNKNRFEGLIGFTAQEEKSESVFAQVSNFSSDGFEFNNLSAASAIDQVASNLTEFSRSSIFGRLQYVVNDKYLFTVNGRYDGSSRFGDEKWGFFPSAAVAWQLGDEKFVQDLGLFQNLKLRASYGISGSDALGPYNSFASYSAISNAYNFNEQLVVGFLPSSLANPDLTWEETTQFDIGLDLSIFEGRLNLVADYYNKETNDLFLDKPLPQTGGVSFITQNIGSLENRGFEIGIDATVLDGAFKWQSGFNISFNKTEILSLGDVDEILIGNIGGQLKVGNIQILKVGEELGSFYGYTADGIWQTGDNFDITQFGGTPQPGDIKYVDINGDSEVNSDDRQIIGNATPDFIGGFNNTFTLGGFDATVFFNFSVGNDVFNANNFNLNDLGGYRNKRADAINYWTPENPSNTIPRPGAPTNEILSSRLIEDASFLRLRELTLGYSLPSKLLDDLSLNKLRLYITGSNLITFTDYTGFDPEVNVFGGNVGLIGTDNGAYPRARTIVLGLNLSF